MVLSLGQSLPFHSTALYRHDGAEEKKMGAINFLSIGGRTEHSCGNAFRGRTKGKEVTKLTDRLVERACKYVTELRR
jgi:hypothetical protein